jgi:hypothetical protein
MLRRIVLWIGGLIERLINRFGGPVPIPPEEMERARREMEERIELDKQRTKEKMP